MCDYSLHAVNTRDARVGDKLEVYQFNTCTKGMRDAALRRPLVEYACAVCLKPGTELSLTAPVIEMYNWPTWFPVLTFERSHTHATATFRKLEPKHSPWSPQHKDGIEFPDGKCVLFQNLRAGQQMTVLQVPVEKAPKQEPIEIREYEGLSA